MVTYERAVEVADTYMQAMSAQDWAAVMELYAEDAVLEDPVGSEVKIGKLAITDFYFGDWRDQYYLHKNRHRTLCQCRDGIPISMHYA